MIRDSVERFAADEIPPRAADIDRDNEFPMDLWPKMGEVGILGVTVEEEYGGAGLGYLEHVVALEGIARIGQRRVELRRIRTFASIRFAATARRRKAEVSSKAHQRRVRRSTCDERARRGL